MSFLKAEPFAAVESMEELLAIAYAMEQEAVGRYTELATRTRNEGQVALAAVFDLLASEENRHIDNVVRWSEDVSGGKPDLREVRWIPEGTFDDEGAAAVSPQLLSAYKSFAMAVRNEERAFAFWTYVAAQAPSEDIRMAAEQMARDELAHAATLRQQRRRAFSVDRAARAAGGTTRNLAEMEGLLATRLDERVKSAAAGNAEVLKGFADEARALAGELTTAPLGGAGSIANPAAGSIDTVDTLCEFLVECYIEAGETLASAADRDRAQMFAARAIERLAIVRSMFERVEVS
ncbi:MAG: ferritin family protein [Devosia sp.]|nr:ferritin family protein [Devosia sp.]